MTTDASTDEDLISMVCGDCCSFVKQARLANARLSGKQQQRRASPLSMKSQKGKLIVSSNERRLISIAGHTRARARQRLCLGIRV